MRPALEPGDWVVSRRRSGTPPRGRIVVFEHPARPGMLMIKRVIGLPGERMDITSGRVAVDGRILAEPWAQGPTLPNGTWHVPPESIFALGDRRTVSAGDGRSTGPIPLVDVGWVMIARYRPLTRAGFV